MRIFDDLIRVKEYFATKCEMFLAILIVRGPVFLKLFDFITHSVTSWNC